MKTNYIISSLIAVLAIPFLLNLILGKPNPLPNIDIVGDSTHWLAFYGSYIGGILAAIIGVFTIYCQSKHNALNIMIQEQSNYIEKLNLELADLVSSVEFWYLGSVSLDVMGIKTKQEDIYYKLEAIKRTYLHKLNELHQKSVNKGHHWDLTYAQRKCPIIQDFASKYIKCYNQYSNDIEQLTRHLVMITPAINIDEFYIFLSQFNKDIKSHTDLFQKPLYEAAKAWVKHEDAKLSAMKNEQKRLLPNLNVTQ